MSSAFPRSLESTGGLILILGEDAEQAARRAMRAVRHRFRRRIGATLRPGEHTPLWNELVSQAQPFLRKRGTKADLARLLNVPASASTTVSRRVQRVSMPSALCCWPAGSPRNSRAGLYRSEIRFATQTSL